MPDTVKTIKFQAIRMNFKNEELILGKGVQTIEFRAIENAKKIYMPKSIKKLDSDFLLPNAKEIVNTRNRVIHGYDSVTPEFLWSLVIKHIPILKIDIEKILLEYE